MSNLPAEANKEHLHRNDIAGYPGIAFSGLPQWDNP